MERNQQGGPWVVSERHGITQIHRPASGWSYARFLGLAIGLVVFAAAVVGRLLATPFLQDHRQWLEAALVIALFWAGLGLAIMVRACHEATFTWSFSIAGAALHFRRGSCFGQSQRRWTRSQGIAIRARGNRRWFSYPELVIAAPDRVLMEIRCGSAADSRQLADLLEQAWSGPPAPPEQVKRLPPLAGVSDLPLTTQRTVKLMILWGFGLLLNGWLLLLLLWLAAGQRTSGTVSDVSHYTDRWGRERIHLRYSYSWEERSRSGYAPQLALESFPDVTVGSTVALRILSVGPVIYAAPTGDTLSRILLSVLTATVYDSAVLALRKRPATKALAPS
jgi:hypothetical protein